MATKYPSKTAEANPDITAWSRSNSIANLANLMEKLLSDLFPIIYILTKCTIRLKLFGMASLRIFTNL